MSDRADIEAVLRGDARWAVAQGNCLELLATLPADCVNLIFGSPPYVGARLYLEDGQDLGIARTVEEWSPWMVDVYCACLRVCSGLTAFVVEGETDDFSYDAAPYLLAADLRRAGFTLRKPPAYRRVGIPGSGGPDWWRNDYEPIICVTRGGKLPFSDNTACGHPPKWAPGGEFSHRKTNGARVNQWGGTEKSGTHRRKKGERQTSGRPSHRVAKIGTPRREDGEREEQVYIPPVLANPGNVAQQTYTAAEVAELLAQAGDVIDCKVGGGQMGSRLSHQNEAPFPPMLPYRFCKSFSPPGGLVVDPFCGSGTTLEEAVKLGRRAIGFDLRPSQVALTRRRMQGVTPPLFAL